MEMSSTAVLLIISTVTFLTLTVLLFSRPNGQAIKTKFESIWSSPVGRQNSVFRPTYEENAAFAPKSKMTERRPAGTYRLRG